MCIACTDMIRERVDASAIMSHSEEGNKCKRRKYDPSTSPWMKPKSLPLAWTALLIFISHIWVTSSPSSSTATARNPGPESIVHLLQNQVSGEHPRCGPVPVGCVGVGDIDSEQLQFDYATGVGTENRPSLMEKLVKNSRKIEDNLFERAPLRILSGGAMTSRACVTYGPRENVMWAGESPDERPYCSSSVSAVEAWSIQAGACKCNTHFPSTIVVRGRRRRHLDVTVEDGMGWIEQGAEGAWRVAIREASESATTMQVRLLDKSMVYLEQLSTDFHLKEHPIRRHRSFAPARRDRSGWQLSLRLAFLDFPPFIRFLLLLLLLLLLLVVVVAAMPYRNRTSSQSLGSEAEVEDELLRTPSDIEDGEIVEGRIDASAVRARLAVIREEDPVALLTGEWAEGVFHASQAPEYSDADLTPDTFKALSGYPALVGVQLMRILDIRVNATARLVEEHGRSFDGVHASMSVVGERVDEVENRLHDHSAELAELRKRVASLVFVFKVSAVIAFL
ncbi:hypothetical protein BV25DRAFT_1843714, partial [Artomyces pyxidatus]